MTCRECLARLGAQADQSDLEVARHLQQCAACRAHWDLLRKALLTLESEAPPAGVDLLPGLHQVLAAERRQAVALAPVLRRERRLATACGLAVLTGLGVYCRLHWPAWSLTSASAVTQGWLAQLQPVTWPDPLAWLSVLPSWPGQLLARGGEAWRQVRQAVTLLTPPTLPVSALWLVLLAAFAAAVNEALTRRYGRLVAPGERS